VGASFAGKLGVCTTSGPGYVLKQETLNLAIITELPLVIIDVQRGGPSTGLPTKTEQGDLLLALYGRNSDSPMPILAPASPGDCFHVVLEAFRIAVKYMTPVTVLMDGYVANSSEPWEIPSPETLPKNPVRQRTDPEGFAPYLRDNETLSRPWASPGTPGLEHRIGGLEKQAITGNVSYDPENHHAMTMLRFEKIARIAREIPELEVSGPDRGELLVVSWGSTFGSVNAGIEAAREQGLEVSSIHLRHLNPFPPNLGEILKRFKKILVPELNAGQLVRLLRAEFLVPAVGFPKIKGRPFQIEEVRARIESLLEQKA